MGAARPAGGRERKSERLCDALAARTEFTQTEWESFGIDDLRLDDVIEVGASYFQPSGEIVVEKGDVRLVSLKWLMELAKSGGVLKRRQDLPKEAFIDVSELQAQEKQARGGMDVSAVIIAAQEVAGGGGLSAFWALIRAFFHRKQNADSLLPIVAISHVWLESPHPDKDGHQLQLLHYKLSRLYGGRGLQAMCRDYGFTDMGCFLDWASLYQKDPELWASWMVDPELYEMDDEALVVKRREGGDADGESMVAQRHEYKESRTDDEKRAFDRALKGTMDLWFTHASTTVVLITELPDRDKLPIGFDERSRDFASRGWTTFERCSAELAKSFKLSVAKWKLVIDLRDERGGAQRRLPTTPKRMKMLLEKRDFTNGADRSEVLELYTKTAKAVLGTVQTLDYTGLPLERDASDK
eukprot:3057337-Prymnesium_polylepis.1